MSRSEKEYLVSVSSPVIAATIIDIITSNVVVVEGSNSEVTLKTAINSTVDA